MTAAMRRLEELLQDPGPGIKVSPSGEQSLAMYQREGQPPPQPASMADDATTSTDADIGRGPVNAPSRMAAINDPVQSASAAKVGEKLAELGEKLGAIDAQPNIPKREDPHVTPAARLAKRVTGITKPSATSGGLFGVFLTWLLGPRNSEVKDAVAASRKALNATFLFSAVINILMLAGPLFMLQVYDRVLSSGSYSTLLTLSFITAALYGIIGLLELARSRIISRVGVEIDQRLSDKVFEASLRKAVSTQGNGGSALRELDSFRQFIAGPAPITFFDAPWTPVYLGVIFMTHWALGIAATIGAVILLFIAWASEQRGRGPLLEANKAVGKSIDMAETGQRNAEAITAMGMLNAYRTRWQTLNGEGLGWQLLAADRLGGMSAISKTLRLLLQSLMLAIAAALALMGQISAGAIIAATIIFGRALAPVEQVIGHWRGFIKARESFYKLEETLQYAASAKERVELPRPKGFLAIQNLRVAAPESRTVILNGITFEARPGQMLAIIGPSASGKSTLARALVGLWPAFGGTITLDGSRLDQWHPEDLGKYLGYLPQSVELFAGTVRQNISRFSADASDEAVFEAAIQAHAHELILALPNGYDTELGAYGTYLSGGQRQRIALARALFGQPPLVVLDEPNSNLDRPGDEALSAAIDGMRRRGQAIILVSHRVQAIGKADLLLLLEKGQQRAFGPRNEVMKLFQPPTPQRRSSDRSDMALEPKAAPTAAPQAETPSPSVATPGAEPVVPTPAEIAAENKADAEMRAAEAAGLTPVATEDRRAGGGSAA